MIRAIIFDVDGTLSETEEIHREAFNQAFALHDLSWQWSREKYRRLLDVSGGKERIRHFIRFIADKKLIVKDTDRFIRDIHAAKTAIYTQRVAAGDAELRPGIRALVHDAIDSGLRLAIATTTSLPNVDALLQAAFGDAAATIFEVICAGDSVPAKKPAPDIYVAALHALQLKPSECVAIEDSRNGLLSAYGAGIPTIVTPGIYTQGQRFDEAALLLANATNLSLTTINAIAGGRGRKFRIA